MSSDMKTKIDHYLRQFLVFLMAVMVVNVLWQVASRYILNDPSAFTDELARYLLIWLGLLGAAYYTGQNQHLALNILENKLESASKAKLKLFINLLIFLFGLSVLVVGGTRLVYISFHLGQSSSALRVPLGYVYLVVPLSGLLIAYYSFRQILHPSTTD